jgi:membrane protein YdbS with pleckstrin-like domain
MNPQITAIRKSPFLFLKRLFRTEFLFAVLPYVTAALWNLRRSYEITPFSRSVSYDLVMAITMAAIQVLIISVSYASWYLPVYEADRRRILYRRSNLFEDKELARTASIDHVKVRQGPLAKRLDYGTLVIYGEDGSKEALVKDISNPARYRREIESMAALGRRLTTPQQDKTARDLVADGEGQCVEFKASLMWDYRRQEVNKGLYEPVMKNLVAFMNTTGGALLIGVGDGGEILGLEPDYQTMRKPDSDGFENVFNMAFNKMIGAEYRRFAEVSFPMLEGQQICVVRVRPSSHPAYLS